jgi:hypothetical protein
VFYGRPLGDSQGHPSATDFTRRHNSLSSGHTSTPDNQQNAAGHDSIERFELRMVWCDRPAADTLSPN